MASTSSASVPPAVQVQAEAFPDGTTDYVPVRSNKKLDPRKPHITELPITMSNWYKHVNWLNTFFIIGVPALGLIGSYWVQLQMKTLLFSIVYYYYTGLGITAGKLSPMTWNRLRFGG
jgi:stearoyl-CoA desaturase (delta-9 desaturase)